MYTYAKPGKATQYIFKRKRLKSSDKVKMTETRPTDGKPYICQDNGDGTGSWVVDQSQVKSDTETQVLMDLYKKSPLKGLTQKQAEAYVDANWSNIENSREAFKKLVELVLSLNSLVTQLAKATL